eukprot:gene7675-8287_t
MNKSLQRIVFFHHPRSFFQTELKIPTNHGQQRWVSTQTTQQFSSQSILAQAKLSEIKTYAGLLEYLRKNHFMEGILQMPISFLRDKSTRWLPDFKARQDLERQFLLLPAVQLFEMPAIERLEIVRYVVLMNISTSSFNEKAREWLKAVNTMHEDQRITSDEGRALILFLLNSLKPTFKKEYKEIYHNYLFQKKDYQSLADYLNYVALFQKISKRKSFTLSELNKFENEMKELPPLEILKLFLNHLHLLVREEIDPVAKSLLASLIRKILSSKITLSNDDFISLLLISDAVGIQFSNQEALQLRYNIRNMKQFHQGIRLTMMLVNPLKSFQSCDKELASILKEKINAIITVAFWETYLNRRSLPSEFFSFIKDIDATFITSSSHILMNNHAKKWENIPSDEQEVILSSLRSYLQEDQVEVTKLLSLYKLVDMNITLHHFSESDKTTMMKAYVNHLQRNYLSSSDTSQVLVLFSKLQYKWSDFSLHTQEIIAWSLRSDSVNLNKDFLKGLIRFLPILCFDSEDAMNASLDSPLMTVNSCLLREISRDEVLKFSSSTELYIDWLKTLPLKVQKQLLSSAEMGEFPNKKLVHPSITTEQNLFIKECKQYLSRNLFRAQDMKHRKIVIFDASSSSIKSLPMHITIKCDGKVITCIQLLKERIKGRGGEMKMDREDLLRNYFCYHTYGDVPIIPIQLEDYSNLEERNDVLREIEQVMRSLIE